MTEQITEDDYCSRIEDALDLGKWTWYHTRDSRRSKEGYPDYTCTRSARLRGSERVYELMFLEVKGNPPSGRGVLSMYQADWIRMLKLVPGVKAAAVWPEDWPELKKWILG